MISKVSMVLIVIIVVFAFPKIYAQQSTDPCGTTTFDCYQDSGFRLTSDPVICMDLPSDRNMVAKMRAYTEDAVMDWENKLNANNPSNSIWNIDLIPTTSDSCNISMQFIAKPTLDQQGGIPDVVGITRFPTDHTAQIEIFYNALSDDGYFLDSQAPDYQIQWTIKHELGHAFGLAHYIMSDEEEKSWSTGFTTTPSIMVQVVPASFSVTGTIVTYPPIITYKDITQLKSLYNNNGFEEYSHISSPAMSSSTISQQISINTDKQVYQYGDHMTVIINVSKITGEDAILTLESEDSKSKDIPIPISELQTSITSPFALNETNSPTGTIKATLSYNGQTAVTSFQIIGQLPPSTTYQDSTQPNLDPLTERSHAYDWAVGKLGDNSFISIIKQLSYQGAIHLPETTSFNSQTTIPNWVKIDAKLWAQGDITDMEFFSSLQYLIDNNILRS